MKHLLIQIFVASIILTSCNKNNDSTENSTVEYQVFCTNSTASMVIAYNNEAGQYVSGFYQNGWKASFTPTNKPFTATLRVQYYNTYPLTVTLKILVNGNIAKEITGVIDISGAGFQQIQYTVQ